MKKILAFSGSSSANSINQKLAVVAAGKMAPATTTLIDIRDFPMPIFSIDIETSDGAPTTAVELKKIFDDHDGFIVACPEFNGSMPAIFKNTIDWMSRLEGKIFSEKPVVLLSTSTGQNGGRTNIDTLKTLMPWWGGNVVATYSLGGFNEEYDHTTQSLKNTTQNAALEQAIEALKKAL